MAWTEIRKRGYGKYTTPVLSISQSTLRLNPPATRVMAIRKGDGADLLYDEANNYIGFRLIDKPTSENYRFSSFKNQSDSLRLPIPAHLRHLIKDTKIRGAFEVKKNTDGVWYADLGDPI